MASTVVPFGAWCSSTRSLVFPRPLPILPSRLTKLPVKPGVLVAKPAAVAAMIRYSPGVSNAKGGMVSSIVLSKSSHLAISTAAEVGLKNLHPLVIAVGSALWRVSYRTLRSTAISGTQWVNWSATGWQ